MSGAAREGSLGEVTHVAMVAIRPKGHLGRVGSLWCPLASQCQASACLKHKKKRWNQCILWQLALQWGCLQIGEPSKNGCFTFQLPLQTNSIRIQTRAHPRIINLSFTIQGSLYIPLLQSPWTNVPLRGLMFIPFPLPTFGVYTPKNSGLRAREAKEPV